MRFFKRNGDLAATDGVPGFSRKKLRKARRVREAVVEVVASMKLRKVREALR